MADNPYESPTASSSLNALSTPRKTSVFAVVIECLRLMAALFIALFGAFVLFVVVALSFIMFRARNVDSGFVLIASAVGLGCFVFGVRMLVRACRALGGLSSSLVSGDGSNPGKFYGR